MWHILNLDIWPDVAFEQEKQRLGQAFWAKPVVVDKPVLDWYIMYLWHCFWTTQMHLKAVAMHQHYIMTDGMRGVLGVLQSQWAPTAVTYSVAKTIEDKYQ